MHKSLAITAMDPNHFGYAATGNGDEANSLGMYCIDTSVRPGHYRSQSYLCQIAYSCVISLDN